MEELTQKRLMFSVWYSVIYDVKRALIQGNLIIQPRKPGTDLTSESYPPTWFLGMHEIVLNNHISLFLYLA